MYINDEFHHKEPLEHDVFEEGLFESSFCNWLKTRSSKMLLSEIYRVPNTSEIFLEIFAQKMRLVNSMNYSMIISGNRQNLDLQKNELA